MCLFLSGRHITKLKAYTEKLNQFPLEHDLTSHSNNQLHFDGQLMKWHSDFYDLLVCKLIVVPPSSLIPRCFSYT